MSKTSKPELTKPENLPAVQKEGALANTAGTFGELYAQADVETKAALDYLYEAIEPTKPFATIRQKGEPNVIAGNLKFNDGRADLELPHGVIVLAVRPGRVCWVPDDFKAPPRCKSIDGITRLEDVPDPGRNANGEVVSRCENCVRRLWPRERNALAERMQDMALRQPLKPANSPECGAVKNIMCCEPDLADAWILTVHGMSVKPTNSYLGRLKNQKKAPLAVVSEITTKYERTEKGDYYALRWQAVEETPKATQAEIFRQAPQLAAEMARSVMNFDAVMEHEEEGNGNGNGNETPMSGGEFPDVFEGQG